MTTKACPNCAEEIKAKAKVCIHCGLKVKKDIDVDGIFKGVILLIITITVIYMLMPLFKEQEPRNFGDPYKAQKK